VSHYPVSLSLFQLCSTIHSLWSFVCCCTAFLSVFPGFMSLVFFACAPGLVLFESDVSLFVFGLPVFWNIACILDYLKLHVDLNLCVSEQFVTLTITEIMWKIWTSQSCISWEPVVETRDSNRSNCSIQWLIAKIMCCSHDNEGKNLFCPPFHPAIFFSVCLND